MSMDTTPTNLDALRREAKRLHKAHDEGDATVREQVRQALVRRDGTALKRADFLHMIAQQHGYRSWPRLKAAAESIGLDVAVLRQRLSTALFHGSFSVVEEILEQRPDVIDGSLGLTCALNRIDDVERLLDAHPNLAAQEDLGRTPIVHLAFSKWHQRHQGTSETALRIAELLLAHGADVNDGMTYASGTDHKLSVLYGAIGHADNMALAQWLLDHGANPNDGESLYHSTELGHHEGLKMLLKAGADPKGTNALLRAMDFHDLEAVQLLLEYGARADDFNAAEIGGEEPWTAPALHQAARRGSHAQMVKLLLDHGADPNAVYKGANTYAYARVFGSKTVADLIKARHSTPQLSQQEALLAQVADGNVPDNAWIDPEKLAPAYRNMIREILHLPGKLDHVKRLVGVGLEYDRPDAEGLTPVQVAGWEGLPEVLKYFLRLSPDLSHINGYGGTLLSTIIHGSENNPDRDDRDYLTCLEMVLTEGVALPRRAIDVSARKDVSEFLSQWADTHPGQVI